MKPVIRGKALNCFNTVLEVSEDFEGAVETLMECLGSKNQKIQIAATATLTSFLQSWGTRNVKIKPVLP